MPTLKRTRRLLAIATLASVSTALLLIVVKLVAWLMTGSVSLLASLIDSVMDAMASMVNLLAVRYSLQPADKEHRFGHGKAEYLASLCQAAFVTGCALLLILHAVESLQERGTLVRSEVGVMVMVFSIICTALLLMVQRYVITQTQSLAIKGDALHYASDLLTNMAVIVALVAADFGWQQLDGYFAIAIAVYMLISVRHIAGEAIQMLMDRQLPEASLQSIEAIVRSHQAVKGLHDLRTRQSGQTVLIQLHLELDPMMRLLEAHRIAEEVEYALLEVFPRADIIIHQDPMVSSAN